MSKEYVVKVRVKTDRQLDREDIIGLIQRLIENGQEEASESEELGFRHSDVYDAMSLECYVY